MTVLTRDRNTPKRNGQTLSLSVYTNTVIYAGALVAVNAAGYAVPATTALNLKAAGRAEEYVTNNPGASGDKKILVERGVFKFANLGTDAVGQNHVLVNCYMVDDQTVAITDGGGTRSIAGKVIAVDDDGVWVEFR